MYIKMNKYVFIYLIEVMINLLINLRKYGGVANLYSAFYYLGGQFEPVQGDHFVPVLGGQFALVLGGQFTWIFQQRKPREWF
jgi:hypothetical protein